MPKRNFSWKNKRVLVTGACGFIGSHLAERLAAAGARVRALVFYHPQGSWGWLDTLPGETLATLEVIPGDVRDAQPMRQAVKDMDAVFHLAALIGIPYSYHAPESYVDTNVKGTLNVLLAARDHGTPRLLVTSTSEVYGTAKFVPIDESHPLQGQSPYSATKIGADRLAESFFRSFSLPVTTVRPFNTYGPRQSSRAVIPTIITQLLAGHREIRLGSLPGRPHQRGHRPQHRHHHLDTDAGAGRLHQPLHDGRDRFQPRGRQRDEPERDQQLHGSGAGRAESGAGFGGSGRRRLSSRPTTCPTRAKPSRCSWRSRTWVRPTPRTW